LLPQQRAAHQRIAAGIPDGTEVDLSLIRLPASAMIFPNPPEPRVDFSFTNLRIPRSVSQAFARRAERIGFGKVRLHDLRGIHSTAFLDAGIPVHTVAQRIGDDPATLLRSYTMRRRSKDGRQEPIGRDRRLSEGLPGSVRRLGSNLAPSSRCVQKDGRLFSWQEWQGSNLRPPVLEFQ
jgi:hypothetical protein